MITPRERTILHLIAEGYGNKEIANELYISERTVLNNQIHLMKKLNAPDVSSIVLYALKYGFINLYDVLESRFSKRRSETN